MKKTLATLLIAATCIGTYAQQTTQTQRQDTVTNDTAGQQNDSTATAVNRPVVIKDTGTYGRNGQSIDDKAVRTPKFDAFKEKMEEPWLGGVLKDIIFR